MTPRCSKGIEGHSGFRHRHHPRTTAKAIRLTFPPLTEERRKKLTKQVSKYAEGGQGGHIRNVRRDAMDDFKAQKKASEMTEDDYKIAGEGHQNLTDKFIKEWKPKAPKGKRNSLRYRGQRDAGPNLHCRAG